MHSVWYRARTSEDLRRVLVKSVERQTMRVAILMLYFRHYFRSQGSHMFGVEKIKAAIGGIKDQVKSNRVELGRGGEYIKLHNALKSGGPEKVGTILLQADTREKALSCLAALVSWTYSGGKEGVRLNREEALRVALSNAELVLPKTIPANWAGVLEEARANPNLFADVFKDIDAIS